MKLSAASAILALAAEVAYADFFRNDFLPAGHVRTDAIINPNCLSDHVHTFYGPPLLYPQLTFDDLRDSNPNLSSGNIKENNSLYWHPAVYHVEDDGKKILQESEMTTVYYNWIPGQTTAFPPGFRMITPGEDVFDEGKTPGAGEMELSISFQSCWDGVNLDSDDHKSHVAFPDGEEEDAPCPSSHPVRIPRLDFFIRWFDTRRAKWRFADDSLRFHADYVSGWDESFLQSLLNGGDGDFDSKVTFRAGIKHEGDDQDLIRQMKENAPPQADTSCITTEVIDNVINLPREACTGTLISPIGNCDDPPAPTPTSPPPTPTPPTSPPPTPTPPTSPPPTSASPISPPPTPAPPTSPPPTSTPPTSPPPTPASPISPPPTPAPPTSPPPTPTPPTSPPPTPTPPTPSCLDSSLKFLKRDRLLACNWVAKKKEKRCRSNSNASHCPSTCERCDDFGCENSKKFFDIGEMSGKCKDLMQDDPDLCDNPVFKQTCRKLCGYCE